MKPQRRPGRRLILLAIVIICLAGYFSVSRQGHTAGGQRTAPSISQDNKLQDMERKRESFNFARQLLLQHGVPFDPDILLEGDWEEKLAPAFAVMPEFREVRQGGQKMEGVQLADTLLLPERVELTGDT